MTIIRVLTVTENRLEVEIVARCRYLAEVVCLFDNVLYAFIVHLSPLRSYREIHKNRPEMVSVTRGLGRP